MQYGFFNYFARNSFARNSAVFFCIAWSFAQPVFSQAVIPMGDDFMVIPIPNNSQPTINPSVPSFNFTEFDYQFRDQKLGTGFPIGHNLPQATNELFYNLELDGYGGLPFGSCLYRSETLGQTISGVQREYSPAEQAICVANENRDLMRVWGNRNPNLNNVLLKNMTIKNAFRTRNVVDGTIVQNSSSLPHTDTFQSFYLGSSVEDPNWLVIQDTEIRNSDNSLMIMGGSRFNGAVYQNLEVGCDDSFRLDTRERAKNDYRAYISENEAEVEREAGGRHACTNPMTFGNSQPAPLWLIDVRGAGRLSVVNGNAVVIVVGSDPNQFRITTRDSNRRIVDHPNVEFYSTIEQALESHPRPPYIEFSCAGWSQAPRGCESRMGYLGS